MNAELTAPVSPGCGKISAPMIELLSVTARCLHTLMEEWQGAPAQDYKIAGLPVSLCFLDEQLRHQAAPAFTHLRSEEPIKAELTVYVTGPLPQFADLPFQLASLGLGQFDVLSLRLHGMELMIHGQGRVIAVLDAIGRNASWLVLSPEGMPYTDQSAPMYPLLSRWFAGRHRFLCHGAAVGAADQGVLILGHGGAGKSTTALACLEAGMQFAGDDRCLLSMAGVPTVYSLYGTAKLTDTARFPLLAGDIDRRGMGDDDKVIYRLRRGELRAQLQLRAILLAQIEDRAKSEVHPLKARHGYLGLASSAALHLPQWRRAALQCFDDAARRLPVYVLRLGSDISSTPPVVRQLLSELQ